MSEKTEWSEDKIEWWKQSALAQIIAGYASNPNMASVSPIQIGQAAAMALKAAITEMEK